MNRGELTLRVIGTWTVATALMSGYSESITVTRSWNTEVKNVLMLKILGTVSKLSLKNYDHESKIIDEKILPFQ